MSAFVKRGNIDPATQNTPYVYSSGEVTLPAGTAFREFGFTIPQGFAYIVRDVRIKTDFEFPSPEITVQQTSRALNRQQAPVDVSLYSSRVVVGQAGYRQVKTALNLDFPLPHRDTMLWRINFPGGLAAESVVSIVVTGVLVADSSLTLWGKS